MNAARSVRQRAFYYTHVFADPQPEGRGLHAEHVALPFEPDGGKTLVSMGNGTHGDHHDLWIDPDDSNHVIDGNDGGGAITFNAAARRARSTWSDQDYPDGAVLPRGHDAHVPFHVCGSQQDNSTLCVPSDTGAGGFGRVPPVAPYQVGGGEPGYIAPHPSDSGPVLRRHQQRLVPRRATTSARAN
jgi:hypothetical protein